MSDPTLNKVLAARGLTHRPSRIFGKREIVNAAGEVVLIADAGGAWNWLIETAEPESEPDCGACQGTGEGPSGGPCPSCRADRRIAAKAATDEARAYRAK